MNPQAGSGCFEAWRQAEPDIAPPGFWQTQGVGACRQGGSVARRPFAIEGLTGSRPAHGLPAGQKSIALMKLQFPETLSILTLLLGASSRQRERRLTQLGGELWARPGLPWRERGLSVCIGYEGLLWERTPPAALEKKPRQHKPEPSILGCPQGHWA